MLTVTSRVAWSTLVTIPLTVSDAMTPSPLGVGVGVCAIATNARPNAHAMQAAANDDLELFTLALLGNDDRLLRSANAAHERDSLADAPRPTGLQGLIPVKHNGTFSHEGTISIVMRMDSKLAPIRKGLLEFLVLKIVGASSVYVPDILRRLAGTEFATQEGTLYPLLSKLRREDLVQYEWQESDAGPLASSHFSTTV
jgi:hypothetical protein